MVILPVVTANNYLPQKQNTDMDLIVSSNNASSCNLTYLQYPLGTIVLVNSPMTKSSQTFSILLASPNFTQLGSTCAGIVCSDGVNLEAGSVCREVTYNGEKVGIEGIYVYIIGLVFIILLMVGLVYVISGLPSNDTRSEEGVIIDINMLKHLRPVLWIIVWGLALASAFIISNMGIAYLFSPMVGSLFFSIYQIMFYITMIGVPVYFVWIFYKIFKDKEMKNLIERGVEIRTP